MKKTKIINLMCLSLILFFSLIIGVNKSAKVYAETANAETAGAETETTETAGTTFEMVYGASIRIGEGQVNGKDMTNGLRFQVKMDETTAKSIDGTAKKLYVLIVPAVIVDLTSDAQIEAHKSAIVSYKEKWIPVAVDSIYESVAENGKNYYFANAMICNLTSDFYGVKFNAVAIIEESGEYTYAKASSATRSIYDVVNSAVLDVYADKIIGSEVAANTKLDYAKWYGTEEYPVAPKTPAQFNKYNELKSTTLKNLSVERQDVMVNKPVVTIGGKEYPITVPEVHGEQDVEVTVEGATVTVPVTIIDAVLTAENIKTNIQSQGAALGEGAYYILQSDIDASGIDWKTSMLWEENNGFKGTIDGRGYAIKNLNIEEGVPGIFNCTENAVVKNIGFTIANFVPQANMSVFGVITKHTLFDRVDVTFNCTFTATTGGILSGNNAVGNTYKDVKIIAEDGEINTLSQTNSGSSFENVTVESMKMNYVYGTSPSVEGVTFKKINVVTLTNNQDILLTNEMYAISLGSEGTGLTINSITCNGVDLGTNLSNLDMSAIKNDMTKHGITKVIVKGEKDGNKVTIVAPVTIITKYLSSGAEFKEATYCANPSEGEKNKGAYYILVHNLNVSDTSFTASDDDWINLGEAGFAGTIDGRGKKLVGVNLTYSLGIFKSLKNATIKNLEIEIASLNVGSEFASVFACYADDTVFEDITITLTTPIVTTKCGLLGGGNQSRNCTFKNITVNAQGSEICRLFSGGDIVKNSKNNIRGITVTAKSVQYMYATTDLETSGFDVTVNLDENQ